MILRFLNLEWKQFFRSSYFGKSIAVNIIMALFALYFVLVFLGIGVLGFSMLKKEYPEMDPFVLVNNFLIFVIVGDLIARYLLHKLPMLKIKPFLTVPIKKDALVHFVLGKSVFSFFNVLPLFFYIPFSVVLVREGYDANGVLGWLFSLMLIVLSANFINFLINKNNVAFASLLTVLGVGYFLQYNGWFDFGSFFGDFFMGIYNYPLASLLFVLLVLLLYILNFKMLRKLVFLDAAVASKTEEATAMELTWVERFGELGAFLKNDVRLIWRNKRTKTVFLMSFLFLFYGVVFFGDPKYDGEMEGFLLFIAMFITGGFTINYGQFIPAWDSSHYKMIMSQNIPYRKFLESKWYLMVVMTVLLYLLSIPYLYYGVDKFLMITAGAIFNIGFNALFLVYMGSYNRKQIDLTKSGLTNYQGTSATQFLIVIPVLGFPMLLFGLVSYFLGFNAGLAAIVIVGLLGLALKNVVMNGIEKKYIRDKYAMIHAFSQEA